MGTGDLKCLTFLFLVTVGRSKNMVNRLIQVVLGFIFHVRQNTAFVNGWWLSVIVLNFHIVAHHTYTAFMLDS